MRTESSADMFYDTVVRKSEKHTFINKPSLPQNRKNANYKLLSEYFVVERPSTSKPYHPSSCKEHYRVLYLEILDLVINAIKSQFNQPNFEVFAKLETLLLEGLSNPE